MRSCECPFSTTMRHSAGHTALSKADRPHTPNLGHSARPNNCPVYDQLSQDLYRSGRIKVSVHAINRSEPFKLNPICAAVGYLDVEQVLRLSARLDTRLPELGELSGGHSRLIDLTEAKVASPDTIAALAQEIMDPARTELAARRVAYFGASPLLARQIYRLCSLRPGMALCSDRKAALSWLHAGQQP